MAKGSSRGKKGGGGGGGGEAFPFSSDAESIKFRDSTLNKLDKEKAVTLAGYDIVKVSDKDYMAVEKGKSWKEAGILNKKDVTEMIELETQNRKIAKDQKKLEGLKKREEAKKQRQEVKEQLKLKKEQHKQDLADARAQRKKEREEMAEIRKKNKGNLERGNYRGKTELNMGEIMNELDKKTKLESNDTKIYKVGTNQYFVKSEQLYQNKPYYMERKELTQFIRDNVNEFDGYRKVKKAPTISQRLGVK